MTDIKKWMPEFKVSAESDKDLMSYFVKTPIVNRVLMDGRWMIIGRKGTGKTAVYEYFRQAKSSEIENYQSIALIKPAIKSNMLKFCKALICKEKLQLPVM